MLIRPAAFRSAKPSKYHARGEWVDGDYFGSQRELKRWRNLQLMERAGEITNLRRQVRYPLGVNGHHITTYVADATYEERGELVVEDVKGVLTDVYKLKRSLMLAINNITIREV